jgi:hypothetical protein
MKQSFLPPVPPPLSRASSEEGDADFLSAAAAIAKTDLDARLSPDYALEDLHYSMLAVNDELQKARAGVRDLLREVQALAAQRFTSHLDEMLTNAFEDLENVQRLQLNINATLTDEVRATCSAPFPLTVLGGYSPYPYALTCCRHLRRRLFTLELRWQRDQAGLWQPDWLLVLHQLAMR